MYEIVWVEPGLGQRRLTRMTSRPIVALVGRTPATRITTRPTGTCSGFALSLVSAISGHAYVVIAPRAVRWGLVNITWG